MSCNPKIQFVWWFCEARGFLLDLQSALLFILGLQGILLLGSQTNKCCLYFRYLCVTFKPLVLLAYFAINCKRSKIIFLIFHSSVWLIDCFLLFHCLHNFIIQYSQRRRITFGWLVGECDNKGNSDKRCSAWQQHSITKYNLQFQVEYE